MEGVFKSPLQEKTNKLDFETPLRIFNPITKDFLSEKELMVPLVAGVYAALKNRLHVEMLPKEQSAEKNTVRVMLWGK